MQPQQAQAVVSRCRRAAAYAAIVLGVLGMVFGLLGVAGVWYARGVVDGLSGQLSGTVDQGLRRANEQLGAALERVAQSRERLQGFQTDAQQLGGGPGGRAAAEQLGTALDRELGPPLGALREAYAAASAWVTLAVDVLGTLDRLPGVDVPQLPVAELQTLDTRLREIDGDLQAVRASLDEQGLPLGGLGTRIAERVASVDTRVAAIQATVDKVYQQVESARATVARINATVARTTVLLASGLTLLLLWNGVLHLLLLLRGRAWLDGDPRI